MWYFWFLVGYIEPFFLHIFYLEEIPANICFHLPYIEILMLYQYVHWKYTSMIIKMVVVSNIFLKKCFPWTFFCILLKSCFCRQDRKPINKISYVELHYYDHWTKNCSCDSDKSNSYIDMMASCEKIYWNRIVYSKDNMWWVKYSYFLIGVLNIAEHLPCIEIW